MSGSPETGATVAALSVTPVKGTRVLGVQTVALDRAGARDNRRFFVVDARERMVNGKQLGALSAVVARYDAAAGRLTLTFPGGESVAGDVAHDGEVAVRFFSRARTARVLDGPWAAALSAHLGQPVRLVEAADGGTAVDRGVRGAVSLVSRASLQRLAQVAGAASVDARRFRMLIEVDGIDAHEEDGWVGRTVQLGAARVKLCGHVGRCLVTSRDPETGEIDLPTLDLLGTYRRETASTEPLPFGVYGEVVTGGRVALGDPVAVEPDAGD